MILLMCGMFDEGQNYPSLKIFKNLLVTALVMFHAIR